MYVRERERKMKRELIGKEQAPVFVNDTQRVYLQSLQLTCKRDRFIFQVYSSAAEKRG